MWRRWDTPPTVSWTHQITLLLPTSCSLFPPFTPHPRAQEVFRHAMHSPVVRLEVVPSENRERYEKSLIGSLFADGSGPNGSPHAAREAPPTVKAKPASRPCEHPASRLVEDMAALEAAGAVSGRGLKRFMILLFFIGLSECKICHRDHRAKKSWYVVNFTGYFKQRYKPTSKKSLTLSYWTSATCSSKFNSEINQFQKVCYFYRRSRK